MLRQTLSSGLLRAGGACRPALPLGRLQTRTFGFGSHVSDNDPEVRGVVRLGALARVQGRGAPREAADREAAGDAHTPPPQPFSMFSTSRAVAGDGEGEAAAPQGCEAQGWPSVVAARPPLAAAATAVYAAAASPSLPLPAATLAQPPGLHRPPPVPCCSYFTLRAGQTVSHIKQVPGWNERLASDAEAVVKAEHDVSRRRTFLICTCLIIPAANMQMAPDVKLGRLTTSCSALCTRNGADTGLEPPRLPRP